MDSIFIKEEDIGDSDIDILADTSIRSDDPMELSRFTTDNSSFDDDSKANIDRLKEELEESLNNQEERDTSWEQSSSSRPKEKKKEKSKKEIEEEEREKMQVLVSNFTEDQLNHYEMFRRAAFPKAAIKRTIMTLRRAPNFSEAEEVLLVDLVKNMPILNSFKTDAASSQLKNEAWLEVEELFNAKSATPRSASALREKYKGLKKRLKRKLADDKLEVTKTGGGRAASDVPLSEAENALAASMGEILTGLQSRVGGDKEIARPVSPEPIPIENLESVPSPEDFSDDPTSAVTHHRPDPLNHPEMSQQLPSQLSSDFERPLATVDLAGCAAHTTKTNWRTYSPADLRSSPSRRLRGTVKRADLRDKISSWAAIKEQTARFNFTKEMAQEMHNAKITNMMEKHHQEMAMMREKHEEEMAHIKAIHELELKWTREKMYIEKKILEEKRQQTN